MKLLSISVILFSFVTCGAGLAVMSVDFGTEFMKIAIVKPGVPMEIVLNKESSRKTPTIVTIRNGERLFAEAALNMGMRFPKDGYRCVIDVLGKSFDNPLVERYRQRYPFYDLQKDPDTGSVVFNTEEGVKYSAEELVAMMLQKAKEYAENFAEQPVSEAVITVPVYFNQAERRAMNRSVELAGLKLLQLINDNTAVALQYGIFRRKMFNETAQHYMFFDMGASATTATVVSYQVVKTKLPASGVVDKSPQLTIRGVGFDRTLGGSEFQQRLTNHLAKLFTQTKKTKKALTDDPRAMMKLYKEAGRVKQVLSANADHFAQVEGLLDDEDFRAKVTREEFETMCSDLFPRIKEVVSSALQMSEVSMDEISEVVLMGGGTRMPKVQQVLQEAIGRQELGKGLNTDEAAALGAVYQAAHLGKGFKVQNFGIREANLYPIQVEFERVKSADDTGDSSKVIKRTLFGRGQSYPQKKVMSFNKHVKDFSFEVAYGDVAFLKDDLKELGNTALQTVSLKGVEEAYSKHIVEGESKGEGEGEGSTGGVESKGVKAHFRMDDSGILHLDKVESVFEKQLGTLESVASTLSKIGSTISNLFGGGAKESEDKKDESGPAEEVEAGKDDKKKEETSDADKTKAEEKDDTGKQTNTTTETDSKTVNGTEGKNETEPAKPKSKTIKEDIQADVLVKDVTPPSETRIKQSHKLMSDLDKVDKEKGLLEKVKNEIEAFVFDMQDKLEQPDYEKCSTDEERIKLMERLTTASDWLTEQSDETPRKEYEAKLKELKDATKDLQGRVKELRERPGAVEALRDLLNHTEFFLAGMKNYTGASADEFPFTQVEYDMLEKLITDTKEWNKTVHQDQAKTALHEKPKFTTEDVAIKMAALDREVKYLVNKARLFRPKLKPKNDTAANDTSSAGNETKTGGLPKKTGGKKTEEKTTKLDPLDRDILEESSDTNKPADDTKTSESGTDKKKEQDKDKHADKTNDEL